MLRAVLYWLMETLDRPKKVAGPRGVKRELTY